MNSHAPARRAPRGFSLVEMTAALAIAAMLLGGLYSLVSQTNILRDATEAENRTALALQEVMERIVRHIGGSRLLIQPSKSGVRNLLAVSLPASVDRDGDGFADADNDKDGLLDEDRSADLAKDGKPGIRGIDDDGDGSIDENSILTHDDDEDGTINEDGLNLHDDDGDGAIDEDYGSLVAVDDDGDGSTDEDWIDPVVYYLSGASLVERLPVPWDVDGSGGVTGVDYVENTVLSGVTLFEVQREDLAGHKVLVHVRLIAMDTQLQVHELSTAVLIGESAVKGFAVLPVVIGLVVLALAVGVLSRQGTALSDTARGLQDESRLSGLLDAAYLAAEKELDARSCGGYTAVTSSLDGNTFGAQFSSVEGSPVALTLSASLVSGGSRTRLVPAETAYDAPKTLQMPITKGAFIKKDKPAENKGSDPNVKTGESVSKENRGLLQVDLSGLPAGVRIDSATLQYKINGKGDNGLVINIHRLLEDWDEDVVSWDVRDQGTILGFPYDIDWGDAGGTHDTEVFASFPGDVSGPGQTVDITSLVRLWVSGDVPNHGMLLRWAASMGAKTADMASDDDAVNAPSVVVTYSCACGSACSVDNYISCDGNLRGNTQVGSFSPSLPTLQGLASVPANQSVAGITFADEGGVIVASGPDLNAYDATGALTGSCTLPNALTGLDYISAGPDVGKLVATTTQPSPLLVIVGATCGVERSQPVTGSALSSPVGVTYLRLPAGHAWEDHFAMVDASGNIEVVDPTGTPVALVTPDFAPAVAGDVAQVYNQERFLLLDAGRNEVMHVLFDGAVEERYDINRFGVGTAGALAVDMASCAHLVGSSATNKVVRLIETPLSQSPQAHWRLDEQSGAAAVDRVGGNDATLSGTPTWQPVGGAVQGALELDAADEGAQVADPGRLNLTGSVSLSGWLYTNTVSGRQPVVSRTLAAGSHQYWLGLDNGAVALQFNDGSARTLTGSATVMPGEWHHLAAVIDTAAGVATVYLDGVADGTTAAGLSLSSGPVPVQLGHDGTDSTIGRIDDVRIFQGALLPADVALLAAEGVSGGGAMGAGMPCDTQNYRDEFATVTFAGTGGSLPWPDAWTEIGENDGVSSGEIRVLTSPRAIRVQRNSRGIQRRVDLSQFTSATLTFEYARYGMDVGDYITVDVGDGTTWTELGRIEGPGDDSTSSMLSMSYDLGAYLQADRYIRFKAYPSMGSSEGAYIDNVDITGCSL